MPATLSDVVDRESSPMEIIDVACRTPPYWGHCDLATGRPVRWAICQGHKGSGGALQDSAATYRESIGGDIRRCNREEALSWLAQIGGEFVAENCYPLHVCERLH